VTAGPADRPLEDQPNPVNAAGRLFLTCRDLEEAFQRTALGLSELAGCERVAVYDFDAETSELAVRATHNLDARRPADFDLVVGEAPIIRQSLDRLETVVVHNPRPSTALPARILRRFGVRNSLGLTPLVSRDLGVVGFAFFDRGGRPFELADDEVALFRAFGELAGLAIQNARYQGQALALAATLERSTIAADLHDGVTQLLFSARLKVDELLEDDAMDLEQRNRLLREIGDDLEQGSQQLRTALHQLSRPSDEGTTPVVDELRALLRHFADRTGIVVDLEQRGEVVEPTGRHRALIVRTGREALWNIEKYANATEVLIRIAFGQVWCVLEIDDDGEGDTTTIRRRLNFSRSAFGLGNLQRDARALGGRVWVSKARRLGGVSVSLSLPLPKPGSGRTGQS
jgi:signal transduction histidine kinase